MKTLNIFFVLIACALLQSCTMLRYEKIDLQLAKSETVLKPKLKKKKNKPYVVIIHNDDPYDTLNQTIYVQDAKIEDKTLIGYVSKNEQNEKIDNYYQKLKVESEDGFASNKIAHQDKELNFNQFHVWVNDSIYRSISTEVRIKTNQILAMEKVSTLKTGGAVLIVITIIITLFVLMALDLFGGGMALTWHPS